MAHYLQRLMPHAGPAPAPFHLPTHVPQHNNTCVLCPHTACHGIAGARWHQPCGPVSMRAARSWCPLNPRARVCPRRRRAHRRPLVRAPPARSSPAAPPHTHLAAMHVCATSCTQVTCQAAGRGWSPVLLSMVHPRAKDFTCARLQWQSSDRLAIRRASAGCSLTTSSAGPRSRLPSPHSSTRTRTVCTVPT